MKLTTEQIEILKEQIKAKEAYEENLKTANGDNLSRRLSAAKETRELVKLLEVVEPIELVDTDTIGLGTKFSATIEEYGYKTTENYLLSESTISLPNFMAITTTTPLAKAVMGKKENDEFSYDVYGVSIKGVINKIYKQTHEIGTQKTIGTIK